VDVAFEEEEDMRRRLDDAPGIGRDAWHAARQTVGLRIVLREPRLQSSGNATTNKTMQMVKRVITFDLTFDF
jgi:hypothetical protein